MDLVTIATIHLFYALSAIREILEPKPWELELADASERIKAISDRDRAARGLRAVDWSTGKLVGEA